MARKKAKTGDKALYAARTVAEDDAPRRSRRRSASSDSSSADSDMDADFLALDGADRLQRSRERDADGTKEDKKRGRLMRKDEEFTQARERAVFDLGGGESDSDDDDDDDDDSEESEDERAQSKRKPARGRADEDDDSSEDGESGSDDASSAASSSSGGSDAESESESDADADDGLALQWGRNKKRMYGGDVADLEIGQDVQDAYDEEAAVQDLIKVRNKAMRDDDFLGDYGGGAAAAQQEQDEKGKKGKGGKKGRSPSDADVLPFSGALSVPGAAATLTLPDKLRLLSKLSPATLPLLEHFAAKVSEYRLQIRPAMEALEAERDPDSGNSALGTTALGFKYLEVKGLSLLLQCLNGLVYLLLRGAEGGEGAEGKAKGHPVVARLNELQAIEDKIRDKVEKPYELERQLTKVLNAIEIMKRGGVDEDDDDDEEERPSGKKSKAKRGKSAARDEDDEGEEDDEDDGDFDEDFDDDDEEEEEEEDDDEDADEDDDDEMFDPDDFESKIVLPPSKSKKAALPPPPPPKQAAKKGKKQEDDMDEDDDLDEQTRAALKAMEADLAGDGYDDKDDADANDDDDGDEEEEEDGLYEAQAKKAAAKKAAKKAIYEVKPKFPTVETTVEGERAIGRVIMKNRGLVAHKPKINRNPRVKKREQYRKALIRRKGAIREVRTGETDNYGGEGTGIKAGVSRSRMFT